MIFFLSSSTSCSPPQEVDPTIEVPEDVSGDESARSMFQEITGAIPGIDEAMSFAEVMKYATLSLVLSYLVPDSSPPPFLSNQAGAVNGLLGGGV